MRSPSGRDRVRRHFIIQQGFQAPPSVESRAACHTALHFQPRLVAITIAVGIALQSAPIFLTLAAVLAWNAAVPRWNPIDALYAGLFGGRTGVARLAPAPPPRRFAQAMASTLALVIGIALVLGWRRTAVAVELVFALAVGALVFGGFCLGAFTYHWLRKMGRVTTGNGTRETGGRSGSREAGKPEGHDALVQRASVACRREAARRPAHTAPS